MDPIPAGWLNTPVTPEEAQELIRRLREFLPELYPVSDDES
ncbi:MAG: hypothetical protein WC381_10755 [Kiritimatiellia bacterium]|jgi:hypothetical protein